MDRFRTSGLKSPSRQDGTEPTQYKLWAKFLGHKSGIKYPQLSVEGRQKGERGYQGSYPTCIRMIPCHPESLTRVWCLRIIRPFQ